MKYIQTMEKVYNAARQLKLGQAHPEKQSLLDDATSARVD